MFLKKRRFLFSFYFWKQKRLKTTKKKGLKKNYKKKKEYETQKRLLVRISLVCFPLLHGVEAQHDHVQDTTKKRTAFKKKRTTMTKKKD